MKRYTVVLMRPRDGESDEPDRLYVATQVCVLDCLDDSKYLGAKNALAQARMEVWKADRKAAKREGQGFSLEPGNYIFLAMFEGHHEPLYFGFQAGFDQ